MNDLTIWVIYDHPTDFPNHFVARLHTVNAAGPVAADLVLLSSDVEIIRNTLRKFGLASMTRSEIDDPVIVESWL